MSKHFVTGSLAWAWLLPIYTRPDTPVELIILLIHLSDQLGRIGDDHKLILLLLPEKGIDVLHLANGQAIDQGMGNAPIKPFNPVLKITTAKGAKSAKKNLKRTFALFACFAVKFSSLWVYPIHDD